MKPFTLLSLQRLTKDPVLSRLSTAVIQTGVNSFPSSVFRNCSHGAADLRTKEEALLLFRLKGRQDFQKAISKKHYSVISDCKDKGRGIQWRFGEESKAN